MTHFTSESPPVQPRRDNRRERHRGRRYRMFKFSIPLGSLDPAAALHQLRSSLEDAKTVADFVAVPHVRDSAEGHLQGGLRTTTPLTLVEAGHRLFFEAEVKVLNGRGAFEAFTHYLTHVDAHEQAKGKAVYERHEFIVSRESIWADVDAWLEVRARRLERAERREWSLRRIQLALMDDELTSDQVAIRFPVTWLNHHHKLAPLAGERARALKREEQRVEAERRRAWEESPAGLRAREEAATAAEAERMERERTKAEAAEKAAEEARQRAAAAAAERRRYEESSEGSAERRRAAEAAERDGFVAMARVSLEVSAEGRLMSWAERQDPEDLASFGWSVDDLRAEFAAGSFTWRGAAMLASWAYDMPFDDGDCAEELRAELAEFRRELEKVASDIIRLEYWAAEGSEDALQQAARRRAQYARFPDLVTLPSPRGDLAPAAKKKLLAAARVAEVNQRREGST